MKVKSISYVGKADVYNMEVEDTHDFVIQGGVVAHNCADACRYFMMSRPIPPRTAEVKKELGDDPLDQRTGNTSKYTYINI